MTGFDPGNNHLLGGKDLLPPRLEHTVCEPSAASGWAWGCCFFGAPPGFAPIYLLFVIQGLWPEMGCEVASGSNLSGPVLWPVWLQWKVHRNCHFFNVVLGLIPPTSDCSHCILDIKEELLSVFLLLRTFTWLKIQSKRQRLLKYERKME